MKQGTGRSEKHKVGLTLGPPPLENDALQSVNVANYVRPGALKGWPKTFESSWALEGPKAKPKANTLSSRAVKVDNNGASVIVDQTESLTGSMKLQERVLEQHQVLKSVGAVDANLPANALKETPDTKSAQATTWNAHVRVRK